MDGAEPLLEGDGAHGGGGHHVRAGFEIGAFPVGAWQEFLDEPHAFERDA